MTTITKNLLLKQIPGYSNYFCTSDGQIWSDKHQKWLVSLEYAYGYRHVYLVNDATQKNNVVAIHRLVLLTWGPPQPAGKPCINHKDLNRQNNDINNLEWCTHQENTQHWMQAIGAVSRKRGKDGKWKWVDKDGNHVKSDNVKEKYRAEGRRRWKEYRENNPEHYREKNREYQAKWAANNKDKLAARNIAYREKNKAMIAAREKAYREENKEQIAVKRKARYEKNKEKIAAYQKEYRARKKAERLAANVENNKNNVSE